MREAVIMKFLFSSLLIAVASSAISAAAPHVAAPLQPAVQSPKAEPPTIERIELARRFIGAALSADQFMEAVRSGIAYSVSAGLEADADESAKRDADKDLKHVLALIEPKMRERLPNLFEAYALVYAREFSAEELQQMTAFAQTPAGKHYLSRRLAMETDGAVMRQLEGFETDLGPIMEQLQKEKCAERAAKRIAAGDTKAKCPLSAAAETRSS
jgi:hypothetical protein